MPGKVHSEKGYENDGGFHRFFHTPVLTHSHMAPFGATTNGICMVFQPATLIFSTLDPILEPQVQVWVPEGPVPLRGQKWRPEKLDFVKGLAPHEV